MFEQSAVHHEGGERGGGARPAGLVQRQTVRQQQPAAGGGELSWDLADSYNASAGAVTSAAFPGSCATTALGQCLTAGGRSGYNHRCVCASQWSRASEDKGSLTIDPKSHGPLRLVTSPAALALGIEALHELASERLCWEADWPLPT